MFRRLAALGLSHDQMAGVLEIFEEDAAERKAKVKARVDKWRSKNKAETLCNVTERSETSTNVSERLVRDRDTRGEDNLQTKDTSGKEEKKVTSPSARSSRGSRIPDDFQPDIDAAVSEGVPRQDAERQARSFCDYWRSKPGKDGLKLDWPATWRVWYRRNLSTPTPRSTSPPKQTVGQQARDELRRMGLLGNATDNENRHEHQGDGSADSASPGVTRRFAIASSR